MRRYIVSRHDGFEVIQLEKRNNAVIGNIAYEYIYIYIYIYILIYIYIYIHTSASHSPPPCLFCGSGGSMEHGKSNSSNDNTNNIGHVEASRMHEKMDENSTTIFEDRSPEALN